MRVSFVALAAVVPAAVALGLPPSSAAQAGRADVQAGNRLYREGRYDEAHEKYLEALRAAPDSPLIRFNDANALYQSEEFQRAVDAYRGAIEADDPALEAQAWYNLGNALYRQQQVEGALGAYKEALRRNPGDTDAKHNLEVALEQLQQQQEQEQQQQSDASDDAEQDQDRQEPGEDGAQPPPSGGEDEQDQSPESQQPEEQSRGEQPSEDSPEDREDRDQQEGQRPEGEPSEPEPGEAGAEPQPGEMSREEAERLLQAITEDPGRIRRQRRSADPGRRTRRPW
jgi:tetratricopeptide (TPR) repeat protein